MDEIKLDFNYCNVNIEKMFDIHDNQNVNMYTNAPNDQTHNKPKTGKTVSKAKGKGNSIEKPKTLKYYKHGNNGLLNIQRHRVDIVYRKLTEWGWIDDDTTPDDFDSFFEGEPRHCNISWKGTNTILTILLQQLLEQDYIEPQTKCKAKSLVEKQFGLTANSDRNRIDAETNDRIQLVLLILNTKNPLPEPRRRLGASEEDVTDAALKAIFEGQLRQTKGI